MYHKQFNQTSVIFYTQLNDQTIQFQTIQFSISTVFCLHTNIKIVLFQTIQVSISTQFECQVFDPHIRPFQVLQLKARMNLGAKAMKSYSTFPKALAFLEPRH